MGPLARRSRDPRGNPLVDARTATGPDRTAMRLPSPTTWSTRPRRPASRWWRSRWARPAGRPPPRRRCWRKCRPGKTRQGAGLGATRPQRLWLVRRIPRGPLRVKARRDRSLERARSGQRRLLRRPQQGAALCRDILRAAYPAIKRVDPGCWYSEARSSAPTVPSCERCTRPASRATTTGSRSTSTTSCSPRCATCTKCSCQTVTPSPCGSTSSAGAAAGRASASSRNRRV